MYFNSQEVSENLCCSYCSHRFTDVVKLVAECGNSICGECHEALLSDSAETREFKCKLCDFQPHKIPSDGLPSNNALMKLIKIVPVPRALNPKTKALRSSIEDIQLRIDMLKSYDRDQEINGYCDLLESEVMLTTESAIKHLNKLRDELLQKITNYRKDLLGQSGASNDLLSGPTSSSEKIAKELGSWSQEFAEFKKKWTDYFVQIQVSWNDQVIEHAQDKANSYVQKLTLLEGEVRNQTFEGKFMKFNENQSFAAASNHLGDLVVPLVEKPGTGASQNIAKLEGQGRNSTPLIQFGMSAASAPASQSPTPAINYPGGFTFRAVEKPVLTFISGPSSTASTPAFGLFGTAERKPSAFGGPRK